MEAGMHEKPVNRNVFRWKCLDELDKKSGIGREIKRLKGFAAMFEGWAADGEGEGVNEGALANIAFLLDHLVDDLEKAVGRVSANNIREIEAARRAQPAAD